MTGQSAAATNAMLTVGVLTPHAASGPEVEIPEMASARLDVIVARIPRQGDTTMTTPRPTSAAARLRRLATPSAMHRVVGSLRAASVDVIAYASTTSGYAIGHAAETNMIGRLRHMAGVPVVTSGHAVTRALKTFGVRRVALVHPPWFEEDMGDLGAAYFRAQEIDVVTLTATSLPKDPDRVRTKQVIDWVSRHVDAKTEAVFMAGNGFRAVRTIEELERRTGQLVLAANQVLLWSILAATGTMLQVDGYGKLFCAGPHAPCSRTATSLAQNASRVHETECNAGSLINPAPQLTASLAEMSIRPALRGIKKCVRGGTCTLTTRLDLSA